MREAQPTLADYETPQLNNPPGSGAPAANGHRQSEFDLSALQDFLLSDVPTRPALSPKDLSVEELEALLAEKRKEEARRAHRQLRASQNAPGALLPPGPKEPPSRPTPAIPAARPPVVSSKPAALPPPPRHVAREQRFEPAGLVSKSKRIPVEEKGGPRLLNVLGYSLETLVIVATLFLFANWALQQAGISFNLLGPAPVADFAVSPSQPGGIVLSAHAGGVIDLPATPTPNLPTPTTIAVATNSVQTVAAPTPTPVRTKTVPPTVPLAIAPTPTPAIVQPVLQSVAEGAEPPPSLPRRLVIPRLNLDSAIKEVTVNLGNWQVADFAVGHHKGTAMPGRAGNMVLAGHRDIRGSVFLRLTELQKGDDFKVYTDTAVYRYVITDISEVAPTEISVMAPTVDPTATLITCTPVGLATRRLIIKARLEK